MSRIGVLLGRRFTNSEAEGRKLGVFAGLLAMGLDGLGSAAYEPEATLTVLAPVGVAGLAAIGPITWVILLLLAILFSSYWQTVAAYPNKGGPYTVAANPSFVGFPRLCRQVARSRFLPTVFALPGRRLVYNAGILFLAAGAGLLLAAFNGITDRLIPLFAVGAFLSFTLSQAGMAVH